MTFDLNAVITFGLMGILIGGVSREIIHLVVDSRFAKKFGAYPNYKKLKRRKSDFFSALDS